MNKPFKASKVRRQWAAPKVVTGMSLVPNSSIEAWYARQLQSLVTRMNQETMREVKHLLQSDPQARAFYTMDAKGALPVFSKFRNMFNKLRAKYDEAFGALARAIAPDFVKKIDVNSKTTTSFSLKGLDREPKEPDAAASTDLMKANIAANVALIKSIPEEHYSRLQDTMWESVTSAEPEVTYAGATGMERITKDLMKIEGMTERRAKGIAADQTSKVYADINTQRMSASGIKKFRWDHSSISEKGHFRQSHVDRNGKLYLIEGSPSELYNEDGSDANTEVKAADRGKPGYAIKCRCRMAPVVDLDSKYG